MITNHFVLLTLNTLTSPLRILYILFHFCHRTDHYHLLPADNIYYSDPDRANAYLAGGAVPNNSQSIAYLLRNDFLTNVENLQAEVSYILREIEAGRSIPDDAARDVIQYSDGCLSGMDKYLALVPPGELENARGLMPKKS